MTRKNSGQLTRAVLLIGLVLWPVLSMAQNMADYTAVPPTAANVITPNVLVILDNSQSMMMRADCNIQSPPSSVYPLPPGVTSTPNQAANCPTFSEAITYVGLLDTLACYTYVSAENRFEFAATKAAINTACSSTQWDGNFLNYVTTRRMDAVKKALIGGTCAVARLSDGSCPASGTTPKITMSGNKAWPTATDVADKRDFMTRAVPTGAGAGRLNGRVPTAVQTNGASPANLYFFLSGFAPSLQGTICVDDDIDPPSTPTNTGATGCNFNAVANASDGDAFVEQKFSIRVAVNAEPTGLIQDFGDRARFGLMQFHGDGGLSHDNGGRVLTPIGSRQSMVTLAATTPTTFANNKAAVIAAIEPAIPRENTPLVESLYEAVRYIAQMPSIYQGYYGTKMVYPLAFSPGANLAATGQGSMGTGELSVLTGSETCPAGYIANACGRDPYFYGSNHTPAWASPSAQVPCCKTYVLIFTDGEPIQDIFQNSTNDVVIAGDVPPAALTDYAHAVHPAHCNGPTPGGPPYVARKEVCAGHKDDFGSVNSGSINGRHWMDDIALWAHVNDLRPDNGNADPTKACNTAFGAIPNIAVLNVAGRCLPYKQTITLYNFYAGFGEDVGRETLREAAKQGGFEDSDGNNLPNLTSEWDKVNNLTLATTPDGIPDTYYESNTVNDLKENLVAAMMSILQKSGSGTSLSVMASSSNGEGAAYQAYYYPTVGNTTTGKEVRWAGYLQGLFLDSFGNLREDTDGDDKLIYQNDKIIRMRFGVDPANPSGGNVVLVDKYADANGDGIVDGACSPCNKGLKDIISLWEAGKQLALKDASTRNILTWVDTDNDGVVDAGEQVAFTTAIPNIGAYLRAGASPFDATGIINFIRGCEVSVCAEQAALRDRVLDAGGSQKTWKLGDIMSSSPTLVGPPKARYDITYGDTSYTDFYTQYKTRRQVIYAGANDGMLHAFNAGFYYRGDDTSTGAVIEHGRFTTQRVAPDPLVGSTPPLGEELWGFIPYQLLPQLKWLTQTDYSHVYYVDLTPKVIEARIFTADADHPNGWGTILIGGMRMGGSCRGAVTPAAPTCVSATGAPPMSVTADFGSGVQTRVFYSAYFALDITNPEVNPKLLWSFTSESLGLTTSYPALVRVNPAADAMTSNTNAKWFVLLGTGPTGYDASSGQAGKQFAINLATGPGAANALVTTFDSGDNNSFMGDLSSLDTNLDYRVDVTYEGMNMKGGGGDPPWIGKLYRLTTGSGGGPFGGDTNPANWGWSQAPTELLATFKCWPKPCGGPTKVGPVSAAPALSVDDGGKFWVFFGTGRLYTPAEKVSTDQNWFIGVKDGVLSGTCGQSGKQNCGMTDLVDVSSATVCTICTGNQVNGVSGVTSLLGSAATTLQGYVIGKDGWYTTLPASRERVLVSPTVFGGTVFFPSFVPVLDVCSGEGSSYLYALFYLTGSAYKDPLVGTYDGGGGNTNVSRSISLGSVGMVSQVAIQIGTQGTSTALDGTTQVRSRTRTCVGSGTAAMNCGGTGSAFGQWSRYLSWADQKY